MILDTLAKTASRKPGESSSLLSGKGSDITDHKALNNKAKKKFITSSIVLELIKVAESEGNTKMLKSLWNTYYCYNRIVTSDGRSFGNYCKNRFCTVCCGNRKADLVNKYLPALETWKDPQFVTLTLRSPSAEKLNVFMKKVDKALKIILKRLKQRSRRKTGIKFKGLRSIECNFNPRAQKYNPHVHLIVEGREAANLNARERFGFNLPKNEENKTFRTVSALTTEWEYDNAKKDWIKESNEGLTKFVPMPNLSALLSTGVNFLID